MKEIYLILSHSGTVVSKIIKFYTRAKFSHISIGMDDSLSSFYSFGRTNPRSMIGGGFVEEGINKGVFSVRKNAYVRVYKINLTDEKYINVQETLMTFINNRNQYKYNYIGIITIMFGKKYYRKNYYFCSQFVAEVLQHTDIVQFNKDFTLIRPEDFLDIQGHLVYEGLLKNYSRKSI